MLKIMNNIENVRDVAEASLIVYSVSKNEVDRKDYKRIKFNLELLTKTGKKAREKLLFTFDGYDNDKREIYMIPEIREFVKNIWKEYKHFFYFLTPIDNNRSVIFACINNFKSIQRNNEDHVELEILYDETIKRETVKSMQEYGEKINDSDEMQ